MPQFVKLKTVSLFLTAMITCVAVPEVSHASVKIWNLGDKAIYYAKGWKDGNLWWSSGYTKLEPKGSASIPSNYYVRIVTSNSASVLTPSGGNSTGKFWQHPINGFTVQESASNSSEVYISGERTTTSNLTKKGYVYSNFSRYDDGKILKIGTYWKVGEKTLSFSHSTSGTKSQSFSYLNNTIMDFKYSISCERKSKGGVAWSISSSRKSVDRYGPILEASTFTSPAKPCYNGTVTLYYTYR